MAGEYFYADRPIFVSKMTKERILDVLNDNLEIDKYLPKHIIIGGCDGELYGINADGYYFNVPEIIEEEYLTLLGNDIEQLPVQVNKLWD